MQSHCCKQSKRLARLKKKLTSMLKRCNSKRTRHQLQNSKRTLSVKAIEINITQAKTQINIKLLKFHRNGMRLMMDYPLRLALMKQSTIKTMKTNSHNYLAYLKLRLRRYIKGIEKKIKT